MAAGAQLTARPCAGAPAVLRSERACIHCGHLGIDAWDRCMQCYRYLKRHGVERPQVLILRQEVKAAGLAVCGACERVLPPSAFRGNSYYGRQSQCRECQNTRLTESRRLQAAESAITSVACLQCGQVFVPSKFNRGNLLCSAPCKNLWWKANHRERRRQINAKYRALAFGANVGIAVDRIDIYERDKWICQLCGESVDRSLLFPNPRSATIDHVLPLSRGGAHDPGNLQLAHFACNSGKRDRC